jgi:hypothetical protein
MDILNMLGITIDATYTPHKTPAGESPQLRWRVSVRRNGREFYSTEYSAGCAHSPEYKKGSRVTAAVVAECETGIRYGDRLGTPVPPPDAADVVHCLLTDASGTDETFEEWAGNLGYDPDSRKAEGIFKACRDVAAALRRTFDRDELAELETAFADY